MLYFFFLGARKIHYTQQTNKLWIWNKFHGIKDFFSFVETWEGAHLIEKEMGQSTEVPFPLEPSWAHWLREVGAKI